MGRIAIAGWLVHVDTLAIRKFTVEIGTFDVDLVQFQVLPSRESEDGADLC